MASLSSLVLSNPRPLRPMPNPNYNRRLAFPLHTTTTLNFSAKANSNPPPPPSTVAEAEEKKSFAVVTGELFIGIALRILKRRGVRGAEIVNAEEGGDEGVRMFKDDSERENYLWKRGKEGIATVVEDPIQPEVLWEQSVKDVEAERRRKAVTSPGFSFSVAGLLFRSFI